jgi:hypothetical protein
VTQSLTLDGRPVPSARHGASLKAGRMYTLTGHVTFARNGASRSVTAALKFRSCPKP